MIFNKKNVSQYHYIVLPSLKQEVSNDAYWGVARFSVEVQSEDFMWCHGCMNFALPNFELY
jgi:hypothetical protein